MSRRSSSARSSRYHPPQGSFLLRVLREVFDPYKKSMLVLDSSAVEWSRPCRTTRSGHGPRRLRTARWLPLGVAQEMADILARRMAGRSEEHTSELQSLMRTSYAVFCLKKKTTDTHTNKYSHHNPTA